LFRIPEWSTRIFSALLPPVPGVGDVQAVLQEALDRSRAVGFIRRCCVLFFAVRPFTGNTVTLAYKFLNGGLGIELKVLDRLTLTEFIGVHGDILSRDFATQPVLYAWFEFGDEVSHVGISTAELRSAAKAIVDGTRHQPVRRVTAIYAKSDEPFTRAREWQMLVTRIVEIEVFRDKAVALEWLRKRVAEQHGFQIEL
jgi:hypothetical protein